MLAFLTSLFGALKAALGFGQQVATNIHDDGERAAGSSAQQNADKDAVIASQQRQADAGLAGPKSVTDAEGRLDDGTF
jgi:hypothetical protein